MDAVDHSYCGRNQILFSICSMHIGGDLGRLGGPKDSDPDGRRDRLLPAFSHAFGGFLFQSGKPVQDVIGGRNEL
jgi:hypothetical protein